MLRAWKVTSVFWVPNIYHHHRNLIQYQLSSLVHPPHFAGFRKFVIYTSAYISTHCLCSHTLPFCKLVCTGRPSFPTQLQVPEFRPSSRWQLNCYHLLPIHFPLDQELLILSPGFASKFLPGNWHGGHALLDYLYKVEEGLTISPLLAKNTSYRSWFTCTVFVDDAYMRHVKCCKVSNIWSDISHALPRLEKAHWNSLFDRILSSGPALSRPTKELTVSHPV